MVPGGMAQPVDFRSNTQTDSGPTRIIFTGYATVYIYESNSNWEPPSIPLLPRPTIKQKRAAQRAGFRALLSDWFPLTILPLLAPGPKLLKEEESKPRRWRARALRGG